ncbi:hypothetical protein LOAG_07281 [Loa loa]|uniref:Uncharacterized protein n=1 Tax=Loa loa TaxID=7209 RepID=A0A1S0TWC5_LOALO|nr:hypothetical protein LOAG_07281 [Loa loa]EFO21205.2 hypothetical protein LOAG_07281 [Loa loa]
MRVEEGGEYLSFRRRQVGYSEERERFRKCQIKEVFMKFSSGIAIKIHELDDGNEDEDALRKVCILLVPVLAQTMIA